MRHDPKIHFVCLPNCISATDIIGSQNTEGRGDKDCTWRSLQKGGNSRIYLAKPNEWMACVLGLGWKPSSDFREIYGLNVVKRLRVTCRQAKMFLVAGHLLFIYVRKKWQLQRNGSVESKGVTKSIHRMPKPAAEKGVETWSIWQRYIVLFMGIGSRQIQLHRYYLKVEKFMSQMGQAKD